MGDRGRLSGEGTVFRVTDTQRDGDLLLHIGFLESGTLAPGSQLSAEVDQGRRAGIRRAHSATHLLHHALHTVLGDNAMQRGSKVEQDALRFDFAHKQPVTAEEIRRARQFVRESFPALADQPILESRVCQYENSVDTHFIVDHHPDMDNVWIVGGGSGHGYKHGIMMGDYVASRVTGKVTDPELDATFTLKDETH